MSSPVPPPSVVPTLTTADSTPRTAMPVAAAYARWAATYDADDNPLQAVDSIALRAVVPEWLAMLRGSGAAGAIRQPEPRSAHPQSTARDEADDRPLLVDLGCGTGRNTLRLVHEALTALEPSTHPAPSPVLAAGAHILGLDLAPAMLERAQVRCSDVLAAAPAHAHRISIQFRPFDLLHETPARPVATTGPPVPWGRAAAVLSSLVAEHVPLPAFFAACAALLAPGGVLLATNMHPDMGARARAGFWDEVTGRKVRVEGYVHGVEEFRAEAAKAGLILVGELREMGPTAEMVESEESLRRRGGKWVGVKMWMGGIWRRD